MGWGRSLLELKDRDPGPHTPYIPRRKPPGSQVATGTQTAQVSSFLSDIFVVLLCFVLYFGLLRHGFPV